MRTFDVWCPHDLVSDEGNLWARAFCCGEGINGWSRVGEGINILKKVVTEGVTFYNPPYYKGREGLI